MRAGNTRPYVFLSADHRRDRRPRRSNADPATDAPHPVRHHVPRRRNSHHTLKFLPSMFADLHNNNYLQPNGAMRTSPPTGVFDRRRRDRRPQRSKADPATGVPGSAHPTNPPATSHSLTCPFNDPRCLSLRIDITTIIRNQRGR